MNQNTTFFKADDIYYDAIVRSVTQCRRHSCRNIWVFLLDTVFVILIWNLYYMQIQIPFIPIAKQVQICALCRNWALTDFFG